MSEDYNASSFSGFSINEKNPTLEDVQAAIKALKFIKRKIKFGSIIENHYASEGNPRRKGFFIRFENVSKTNTMLVTDLKGNFWNMGFTTRSKFSIIDYTFKDGMPL